MPEASSASGGERVRFVGKHSKDGCLSIYVQKRNLLEYEGAGGQRECEPLGCIVRIKREAARDMEIKGQVTVVGVLARFVCDFGLQYTEHALYQVETQLYPPCSTSTDPAGGIFDMSTRFVTSLPDEWHFPFLLRLPPQLPPSVTIKAAGSTIPMTTWGLTWYVFAYVASAQAVRNTLERHGMEGAWPRLRIGRRHSKVFLSFGKACMNNVDRICQSLPPPMGTSKRRAFLSSSAGSPLWLEASLDKAAYQGSDQIQVNVKLRNNGRQRVNGIRITMKQLLTVKYANDPRQHIKTTVGEFEVSELYRGETSFDTIFAIDLGRLNLFGKGQVALAAHLPRRDDLPAILASSTAFAGVEWRGASFGLERLRLFSIEYYLNVHAVIPWASDVIVKLPFHLASGTLPDTMPSSISELGLQTSTGAAGNPKTISIPQMVKGNLITFDEQVGDDYEGDEADIDDLPNAGATLKTHVSPTAANLDEFGSEGLSWKEDLHIAKDKIEEIRGKTSAAHKIALSCPLDSRSLTMQFGIQRKRMIREFLEQINILVTKDVPRMKIVFGRVGNDEAKTKVQSPVNSFVAQATAARLEALGMSHAALVPLSHGKQRREERLEIFSRLVDDFELLLVRAERGATQDALGILDRMTFTVSSDLIKDIPGWLAISKAFGLLRQTIMRGKYADPSGLQYTDEFRVDAGEELFVEFDAENEKDALIGAMATQFQNILLPQTESAENEGSAEDFAFPHELLYYCVRLEALLLSDLPRDCLGPVAFFHWRFLLALAEHYFLGTASGPLGLILMLDSANVKWSKGVEATVPARFLLKRRESNELEETAQQIVMFMQRL